MYNLYLRSHLQVLSLPQSELKAHALYTTEELHCRRELTQFRSALKLQKLGNVQVRSTYFQSPTLNALMLHFVQG